MVSAGFNSVLKCVSTPEIAKKKFTKNSYLWGSRSFKVINVGSAGKLVSGACYDTPVVDVAGGCYPLANRRKRFLPIPNDFSYLLYIQTAIDKNFASHAVNSSTWLCE